MQELKERRDGWITEREALDRVRDALREDKDFLQSTVVERERMILTLDSDLKTARSSLADVGQRLADVRE